MLMLKDMVFSLELTTRNPEPSWIRSAFGALERLILTDADQLAVEIVAADDTSSARRLPAGSIGASLSSQLLIGEENDS